MVYAPRRPSPIRIATQMKREVMPAYQAAMDAIPEHHADAIRAYIATLHQEAAAQRAAASRFRAALESGDGRNRGDGERPSSDPFTPTPTPGKRNR